jgi:hypothetical protein
LPARHTKFMKLAGASLLLCGALATVGVADAATSHHKRHHARSSSTSTSNSSSRSSSATPGPPAGETELSGETATKTREAALAAVPGGTVLRASTESASDPSKAAYEVHVRKSEGSVVEVLLDSSYKVLAVNFAPARARGGCPGGPPGAGAGAGAPSGSSLMGPPPRGRRRSLGPREQADR